MTSVPLEVTGGTSAAACLTGQWTQPEPHPPELVRRRIVWIPR